MIKVIIHKIKGQAPLPSKSSYFQLINGLIGGILGITIISLLAEQQNIPLLIAPFGATCVLLFAVPDSPLAQPRNVIGGHLISSFIGIIFLNYIGTTPIEMGLAVGLATFLMQLTRTVHAPAGADPLLILMTGHISWSFLIQPVLIGSVLLVLIALVVNNIGKQRKWPKYW